MNQLPRQQPPVVAVCGAGTCDAATAALAYAVGQELARAGAVLVCGGLGGVMAAACQGAAESGGMTVGFLPGTSRSDANAWVQLALPTGMGHARNVLIVHAADAVIAIAGAYGTLSEIALARAIGRTVIGLHTWELGTAPDGRPHLLVAHTPSEAVALALRQITQPHVRSASEQAE